MSRIPPRRRPVALYLAAGLAAGVFGQARADSLCAFRTESGAYVYTNTPSKDGTCTNVLAEAPPVSEASSEKVARFDPSIRMWSNHYGVSPRLVHAVIATESAYNPGAVSSKGARGLMQLMPETARSYGVGDSFNTEENIRGGVAHLRDLLEAFGGDVRLAVAAYNAGAGAVQKYSGVPPFPETREYVKKVLARMKGKTRGLTGPSKEPPKPAPVRMTVDASGVTRLSN